MIAFIRNLDDSQKKLLKQVGFAWVVVMLLIRLTYDFSTIQIINDNAGLLTALFLLYIPIIIFFRKKEGINFLDVSIPDFLYSFKIFIVFSLIVFIPLLIGNHFFQKMGGYTYHSAAFPRLISTLVSQVLITALPEEFFFRGYMQGRFNQIFGKPWKLLGAPIGIGFFLCAFIFAISHCLVHYEWWQLFIFFPALGFGWLREKTGTITAPILFHALCNIFAEWVALHYVMVAHAL